MKYLLVLLCFINLYALNPVELYNVGKLKKAEQIFKKYKNSAVAEAYLAKIYYKTGKYKLSEKYIKKVLKSSAPPKVKRELGTYLRHIEGIKGFKAELSAGLLYDSNVNFAKKTDKRYSDLAHIEEVLLSGFYLKDNFDFKGDFKFQNRGYIQYPEYNRMYFDVKGSGTYYGGFADGRLKLGYETNTLGANSLYKSEFSVFKTYGFFTPGVFVLGEYYENGNINALNLGGGLRVDFKTSSSDTVVSLYSYNSSADKSVYDNVNYKADVKWKWNFSKIFLYVNYYYNISDFASYRVNMHYFDISFNSKETSHIYYSMGMTDYYSLSNKNEQELRKYEVYAKFIYSF